MVKLTEVFRITEGPNEFFVELGEDPDEGLDLEPATGDLLSWAKKKIASGSYYGFSDHDQTSVRTDEPQKFDDSELANNALGLPDEYEAIEAYGWPGEPGIWARIRKK